MPIPEPRSNSSVNCNRTSRSLRDANFDSPVLCPARIGRVRHHRLSVRVADECLRTKCCGLEATSFSLQLWFVDWFVHTGDVQCAHFVALIGMVDKHSGQSFVVGTVGASGFFSRFTCFTNRKITNAMMMKSNTVCRKTP